MSEYDEKRKQFEETTVQISFKESTSVKLNDEVVEIGSNQTMNLPRNIAFSLENEGKGIVDLGDVVSELKQTLSKEKLVGEFELAAIDEFFYMRIIEYCERISGPQKESFMNLLHELFRMRNGKIIKYASTSLHLLENISSKLSFEEIIFLKEINDSYNCLKNTLFSKNKVVES